MTRIEHPLQQFHSQISGNYVQKSHKAKLNKRKSLLLFIVWSVNALSEFKVYTLFFQSPDIIICKCRVFGVFGDVLICFPARTSITLKHVKCKQTIGTSETASFEVF